MISEDSNLSRYIDRLIDMYYPSFDPFFTKTPKTNIKDIIKHDIVGNYLYEHPGLDDNDIRKKYIFIAVIKFLSLRNYEHIDYETYTLRGEIQTLLFKEQAKQLAEIFIENKSKQIAFNKYKTKIKKEVVINYLNKSL